MGRQFHAILMMGAVSLLAGCGTNVPWLLERDSAFLPRASVIVSDAELAGPELSDPVYAAEDSKIAACRFMNEAVVDRMMRDPSFGEQFVSDVGVVVALLVPIPKVERCAEAFDSYVAAVDALEQRLGAVGSVETPLAEDTGG
ncbi:MAG: hypothetical protein ACREEE_14175 [Dongiaceae bacterium]